MKKVNGHKVRFDRHAIQVPTSFWWGGGRLWVHAVFHIHVSNSICPYETSFFWLFFLIRRVSFDYGNIAVCYGNLQPYSLINHHSLGLPNRPTYHYPYSSSASPYLLIFAYNRFTKITNIFAYNSFSLLFSFFDFSISTTMSLLINIIFACPIISNPILIFFLLFHITSTYV